MTREPGYYWVGIDGAWNVANWSGDSWKLHGVELHFSDYHLTAIGPRIPEPPQILVDLETASVEDLYIELGRLAQEEDETRYQFGPTYRALRETVIDAIRARD